MTDRQTRFARLAREARPSLTYLAMRLTHMNRDDSDDLVALTLLKAWRSFDAYQGDKAFVTWASRILTRNYFDLLKQRRCRPVTVPLEMTHERGDGMGSETMDYDCTPDPRADMAFDGLFPSEVQQRLKVLIDGMPIEVSGLLSLIVSRDMKVADAARHLGLPRARLNSAYNRATNKMRREVQKA